MQFEKNGVRRDAYSPADAVALRFDGWSEVPDEVEARRAAVESAQPVVDAVEKPKRGAKHETTE